ncbi:MAG: adenosylmethionine decarboxylase [Candidatus Micrarchaeaceae archaeon]
MKRSPKEESLQLQENQHKVVGKHVYGNLYGIEHGILTNMAALEAATLKAAEIGNMHIVSLMKKQFKIQGSPNNGGVSIIAIIEESHIALHTWPESSYATIDIYSCGAQTNPDASFSYFVEVLKPKTYKKYFADRSN